LHIYGHQDALSKAAQAETDNTPKFILVIIVLLLIGVVVAHRVFQITSKLIADKIKMEEMIRHQTEQSLQETSSKLELILESAGEGIYGLDREGRATFLNPAAEKILGYSSREYIGKFHHEMCDHTRNEGSPYPSSDCIIQQTLQDGQTHKATDEVFWTKEGAAVPVEFVSTPILVNEEVIGAVVTFKDISERKIIERNTREELVRAQAVSHVGSWVWDMVKDQVTWSDQMFRNFGLKPQQCEVDYELFINAVHPDDREFVNKAVAKAAAGEEEYDIVHRVVWPDGTIRYIAEKSEVIFGNSGKAVQMIGTGQDITEQKLAEELSLRFGRIMEEAFNEIYIMDQDTFKFIQVNKSALKNMQYTMTEMATLTPANISPDFTPEQLEPAFGPLREGIKDRIVIQSHHVRKDGSQYPVEVLLQISKHETPPKIVAIVQDMTEKKQAEDASLRFGRIMEKSFNEIFIFDAESLKFTQVNQGARENLGYTMEELSQISPVDIKPEYTLEQFESLLQTLRDGTKELLVFETIHMRKDGSTYPVEIRLQLSKFETPPQFVAIVQDITDRKKAERAMQEAMQTLEVRVRERTADLERLTRENELILNTAGEGIYGLDLEGNTTFLNPAAEEILGYSSDELIGKSQHVVIHHSRVDGSPYPKEECHIFKAFNNGQAYKVSDDVFWRKDGTPVPVEYVSNPIHEDGKVVGAVITFKDISDRKKAEEALRGSEEKFRKYFELPLVGIAITSPEKGWLEVNDKLCDYFGYPREELVKMNWAELTYPDDLEADVAQFEKLTEGSIDGYTLEKRFIHKSGKIISLWFRI
jgi:PAS domain S-box-containing protein